MNEGMRLGLVLCLLSLPFVSCRNLPDSIPVALPTLVDLDYDFRLNQFFLASEREIFAARPDGYLRPLHSLPGGIRAIHHFALKDELVVLHATQPDKPVSAEPEAIAAPGPDPLPQPALQPETPQLPTTTPPIFQAEPVSLALSILSGNKVHTVPLTGPQLALDPGSLTADGQSTIYIADRQKPLIMAYPMGELPEVILENSHFLSHGQALGGLAFHRNRFLLVSQLGTGRLFRIPLSNPFNFRPVELEVKLPAAHKLLWSAGGELVLVSQKGLIFLQSNDDWDSAQLVARVSTDLPAATLAGPHLFYTRPESSQSQLLKYRPRG